MENKHYLNQYHVVGRRRPEKEGEATPIYRMKIFARNKTLAKAKFWNYMKTLKKLKRVNGETLGVFRIPIKKATIAKNFAISLRYRSKSGVHNMYKEYRDVDLVGAVEQMYDEMASRHRARATNVHILKAAQIPASKCKRSHVTQFHDSKIKFPVPHFIPKEPNKSFRTTFKVNRPSTA